MATTSSYPAALDSLQTPGATNAGPPTHEDIHLEIADAVEKVQAELGVNGRHRTVRSYADSTARDAANASPLAGHVAWLEDVSRLTIYDGSGWVDPTFDWAPYVEQLEETGFTSTVTKGAGWTAVGTAAQTVNPPASWGTFRAIVRTTVYFTCPASVDAVVGVRGSITDAASSVYYGVNRFETVANSWRGSATIQVISDAGFVTQTPHTAGGLTIRPEVNLIDMSTGTTLDIQSWWSEVSLFRVS